MLDAIVVWIIVGLVAGFAASLLMGEALGLIGDIIVGILGALIGGFVLSLFGVHLVIADHPILTQIVVAFIGAALLLGILRLVGVGRRRRRLV